MIKMVEKREGAVGVMWDDTGVADADSMMLASAGILSQRRTACGNASHSQPSTQL